MPISRSNPLSVAGLRYHHLAPALNPKYPTSPPTTCICWYQIGCLISIPRLISHHYALVPHTGPDQILSIGSSVGHHPRTDLDDGGPVPLIRNGRPRCHCTSYPTPVNCSSTIAVVIGPPTRCVRVAWGVGDNEVAWCLGLTRRQPVTTWDIGAAVTCLLDSTYRPI